MINLEELKNKITFADCYDIMRQLPDKCIDLVFTDPPYGKNCDGGSYVFGKTPKTLAEDINIQTSAILAKHLYKNKLMQRHSQT